MPDPDDRSRLPVVRTNANNLKLFGREPPPEVTGQSVLELAEAGRQDRSVIFGMFGGAVGVTDGRYSCFVYPPDLDDETLREYT